MYENSPTLFKGAGDYGNWAKAVGVAVDTIKNQQQSTAEEMANGGQEYT